MQMPDNGVLKITNWSFKSWWSASRQVWLVQVEHYIPERGGWIRAWLVNAAGELLTYLTLAESTEAIEMFAEHPQWDQCREFAGV